MDEDKKPKFVVDPSGHIVKWPRGVAVKEGWRLATDADFRKAAAIEADRAKAESEAVKAAVEKARAESETAVKKHVGPLHGE